MTRERVTVQEAARRLGIEEDAIRERIQRGTLEHDKAEDGRVYVYLDPSQDIRGANAAYDATEDKSYVALLVSLRDQVSYLRSILQEERDARRRADTIIAQLAQANAALAKRMPELEAAQTHEKVARGAAEGTARMPRQANTNHPRSSVQPREPLTRPWWRRLFGG